jgi:hypothetical protein
MRHFSNKHPPSQTFRSNKIWTLLQSLISQVKAVRQESWRMFRLVLMHRRLFWHQSYFAGRPTVRSQGWCLDKRAASCIGATSASCQDIHAYPHTRILSEAVKVLIFVFGNCGCWSADDIVWKQYSWVLVRVISWLVDTNDSQVQRSVVILRCEKRLVILNMEPH